MSVSKELMTDTATASPEETERAGEELARALRASDSFVALYGDLGAGKTAFVRGMARVLAPNAYVHSPTYTIVNVYENKAQDLCFSHFDLYRLRDEDDLYSAGYDDYLPSASDRVRKIAAVEWCEKIPSSLPESYISVKILTVRENTRHIIIERITNA